MSQLLVDQRQQTIQYNNYKEALCCSQARGIKAPIRLHSMLIPHPVRYQSAYLVHMKQRINLSEFKLIYVWLCNILLLPLPLGAGEISIGESTVATSTQLFEFNCNIYILEIFHLTK